MSNYNLVKDTFCIDDYDKMPAFSSFLPGLAGIRGIPMWVFYTNRGQAINSFGIHHKDNAIMEFNPANTAYENTGIKGFRTFLKVDGVYYEPFMGQAKEIKRKIQMKKNSICIEDVNTALGLKTEITYFVLPTESIGALVRKVTITNLRDSERELDLLDGMAKIIPFGIRNSEYKQMSNLLRSWTKLDNLDMGIPVYKMLASSDDSSEVKEISNGGYFMMSTALGEQLPIIYDPDLIFDYDTSYVNPIGFFDHSASELVKKEQYYVNKIPCGMAAVTKQLEANESYTFVSYIGYTDSVELINSKREMFKSVDYIDAKCKEADALVEDFMKDVKTKTAHPIFDQYIEQCYLDNFLRGGYPYVFEKDEKASVVHLFSRKHGDPERDYNFFSIAGEYYSQGNGNYRDVCQNRRNDVFFNPLVREFDIKSFYSLIQIDGYNPLEIRPSTFAINKDNVKKAEELIKATAKAKAEELIKVIQRRFTPGEISNAIAKADIKLNTSEDTLITELLAMSTQEIEAGYGEGYWCDHWDYNLDMVENYLMIYPDKKEELLFGSSDYRYYDSPVFVQPRKETYVLTKNGVRSYQQVVEDEQKVNKSSFKKNQTNWLKNTDGSFVTSNLFAKMISLACNKFALLDPCGMGIGMDGGKPGWNDAMNGLPGLLGSSVPETCELSRQLDFMIKALEEMSSKQVCITMPVETASYFGQLIDTLRLQQMNKLDEFTYWDLQSDVKEAYRESVRGELSGKTETWDSSKVLEFLRLMKEKVDDGVNRALVVGNGIIPTYFTYEATKYEKIKDASGNEVMSRGGYPLVKVLELKQQLIPNFLEGPARALPTLNKDVAAKMHQEVKASDIYDKELKMYKTSESIEKISYENGRIRVFTPGWLERESIFLHMEYKYFLSLLKAGLYDEYYEAIKVALIPFLSPEKYGRSILENSSFIASSVNPNPAVRGRGYVARLSGSTVELLSMWIMMFSGKELFSMKDDKLSFHLEPALPADFFNEAGEASFTLMSNCKVVYHNTTGKATYGENGAKKCKLTYIKDGVQIEAVDGYITGEDALLLRNGGIKEIHQFYC